MIQMTSEQWKAYKADVDKALDHAKKVSEIIANEESYIAMLSLVYVVAAHMEEVKKLSKREDFEYARDRYLKLFNGAIKQSGAFFKDETNTH